MSEAFRIKNIDKVKGKRYILYSLLSIIVCGSIAPSLFYVFIVNHFHLPHYYHWGFCLTWGAMYGWIEPIRRYYDTRYDRLYKKFKDNDIFKKLSRKNSFSYFFMPRIFVELLAYRRIKDNDLMAVDTSYHYAPEDRFKTAEFFHDHLTNAIDNAGITPKLILKSNIYPRNEYVVFFETQEDYNLTKLSLNSDADNSVYFVQGKELLEYANRD